MWTGWRARSLGSAMARIPVIASELCQDRVEGMEDAPEKRPSFPYLSVVRAFVRDVATSLRPSSLQNARSSSGSMIRWNTTGKRGAPGSTRRSGSEGWRGRTTRETNRGISRHGMIRKSGNRFSEKIMLKQRGLGAMAIQSNRIAL